MNRTWHDASVELVDHYPVTGADGTLTVSVPAARVAIEGGFAHLDIPGTGVVQVVSAPAVRLITYRTERATD
ncbi:hypothetical protein [Embleya scabrispora]|uniref:hypothetical protein n=1 Tax=Embleya scabrispora TaxID=159449 RepID=UPI000364B125|nr:hypothetical protein [Embleya scabrispora]MYS87308.1 hypothetical protein [Streptomyces sp. SID5474]